MAGRIKGQGSKWIRKDKRLAIYLRDGLACAYCGATVESSGAPLSLDHLVPCSAGGGNHEGNLITACRSCNSRRQDTPLAEWLRRNNGEQTDAVATFIANHTALALRPFRIEAKAIIARRRAAANS